MSNDDYQHRRTFCQTMKEEIIKFPEIPGIKWVSKTVYSIVEVPIELHRRDHVDLGIATEESNTMTSVMYLDLDKLTIVREYFPKGDSETPSENECIIEVNGVEAGTVVSVSLKSMMKAWLFFKKYDSRNI